MNNRVEIENLTARYGDTVALRDVSITLEASQFITVLGPSGCGKTTLLRVLAGFVEYDGRVLIDGVRIDGVPPHKRGIGIVFQDYALFPHMSVGANVGFGLRMKGVARPERQRRARDILAMVGLAQAFDKKPHQLSGGQRQRVALARALVVEPAVLLLDEPLGALDLKLRRQMQDELKAIQKRVGTAFVHVTHDQEEAMALADHCVVMNNGRVEDEGTPERVYARPSTRFSATFMGESTLISGEVTKIKGNTTTVKTAFGSVPIVATAQEGAQVTLAIRPEHLLLFRKARSIPFGNARVTAVVFQGSFKRVLADSTSKSGPPFIAKVPVELQVAVGDVVSPCCHIEDLVMLTR